MNQKVVIFSTNRFVRGERILVGGFADRLKGLLFTYYLSKISGRKFMVDWDYPFDLSEIYEKQAVDWSLDKDLLQVAEKVDLIHGRFTEQRKKLLLDGKDGVEALFGYKDVVKVHCNSLQINLFNKEAISQELASLIESSNYFFYKLFNELFLYQVPACKMVENNCFLDVKARNGFMVGLQFRTGGAGGWDDPRMDDVENIDKLLATMFHLLSQRRIQKYSIYLTTDNNEVKEIVKSRMDGVAEILMFDEDPVHLDRSDFGSASQGAIQTCFEHYLLGECDLIVLGNGGFGLTAAYRQNKPVHRYFQVNSSTEDIRRAG